MTALLRLLVASFLLVSPAAVHAQQFTGIVAFGDSLSDMGNRWIDSKKTAVKFKQTWVAQLAGQGMYGFAGFTPSGTTTFHGGSNYAVGGAGTEATAALSTERNRGHHLGVQVTGRYLNPQFNTAGIQPEALHIIVIGANDIMQASIGLDQMLSQWATLDKAGIAAAKSAEHQIAALAQAGVRHVLWGDIFDITQAPALQKRAALLPSLAPVYLAAVKKAVLAHNTEMDAAIARLQTGHPGLAVTRLKLFEKFTDLAATPEKYGLADVTSGADDSRHLFSSDGLHPSAKGHRLLAEYAFELLTHSTVTHAPAAGPPSAGS